MGSKFTLNINVKAIKNAWYFSTACKDTDSVLNVVTGSGDTYTVVPKYPQEFGSRTPGCSSLNIKMVLYLQPTHILPHILSRLLVIPNTI